MLRKSIVVLFAAMMMPSGITFAQSSDYGSGVHLYFSGRHQEAITALNSAIIEDSQDARAYYFRGLAQLASGNSYAADADFNQGAMIETAGAKKPSRLVSRSLERVQGETRMRLEKIRRNAIAMQKGASLNSSSVASSSVISDGIVYGTPIQSYPAPIVYGAVVAEQMVIQQPIISQPTYSTPSYPAPMVSGPIYSTPVYSNQIGSAPVYSTPVYSTPAVNQSMPIVADSNVPNPVSPQVVPQTVVSQPSAASANLSEPAESILSAASEGPSIVESKTTEIPNISDAGAVTSPLEETKTIDLNPNATEMSSDFQAPQTESKVEPFGAEEIPVSESSTDPFGASTESPATEVTPQPEPTVQSTEPTSSTDPFGAETPATETPATETPTAETPTAETPATPVFETPTVESASETPPASSDDPFGAETPKSPVVDEPEATEATSSDPFGAPDSTPAAEPTEEPGAIDSGGDAGSDPFGPATEEPADEKPATESADPFGN